MNQLFGLQHRRCEKAQKFAENLNEHELNELNE